MGKAESTAGAKRKAKNNQRDAESGPRRLRRTLKRSLFVLLIAQLACFGVYVASYSNVRHHHAGSATASTQNEIPATGSLANKTLPGRLYDFPDGGRKLFPKYRLIALYGSPEFPELGALGQQNLTKSLARVKKLAKSYQPLMNERALPTFEIIATVASASPTENGDYSRETPASQLEPWVEEAKKAGVYVVLDLQSGRSDFLKQAKEYKDLLKQPNVGLALDPEWRLKPDQVPLEQIGSASTTEINQTADWLAKLARKYKSPQKLFLLHQFKLDMIGDRAKLDTSHKELAYAIQMDGQGTPAQKADTWRNVTAHPPKNARFGWKNFYRMDKPMRSPKSTMRLKPVPWYVSYQ